MSMWIVPAIHMRILLQFSSAVFLNSGPHLVHLFYCEQACVFKFLDFSVIPKHRLCFIYCDTSFDGWSIASLLICLNLFPFFSLPLLFSQPPFFFFPLCFFFSEFSHPSLSPHNPSFMSPAKSEGSSHHKGKRLSLTTHPLRPRKAKRLPILNRIIPSRRKGLATLATSALLSSIHGMIPIHISLWCLMAIRVLHQAVCGFPLSGAIRNFLGLYWLSPSPISPSVRGMCYPCPSSLNSSQVHHLVGKSGLIRRFLIRVSWVHCSKPVC